MKWTGILLTLGCGIALADPPASPVSKPIQLQIRLSDAIEDGLSGRVKKVEEKNYSTAEDGSKVLESTTTTLYNPQGSKVEILKWKRDPKTFFFGIVRELLSYDEQGNFLKKEMFDAEGKLVLSESKIFNVSARTITTERQKVKEKATFKEVAFYDDHGRIVKSLKLETSGKTSLRMTWDRDETGREIAKVIYDEREQKLAETHYKWNADGSLEETWMGAKRLSTGNPRFEYSTYDGLGNWTTQTEVTTIEVATFRLRRVNSICERSITYY